MLVTRLKTTNDGGTSGAFQATSDDHPCTVLSNLWALRYHKVYECRDRYRVIDMII